MFGEIVVGLLIKRIGDIVVVVLGLLSISICLVRRLFFWRTGYYKNVGKLTKTSFVNEWDFMFIRIAIAVR